MVIPPPPVDVASWSDTPLGAYLLAREWEYFDRIVADRFGYNALQLGMQEFEFLRASRIPLRCRVGTSGNVDLFADPRDLPIATSSIDLVLLPHVLEFTENPHQILREVHRVLMPEGHVLISCFNPWSLWGFGRLFHRKHGFPWDGRFINLPRMKDWLALLGLEVIAGQMSCYAPPCRQEKWLRRFEFMEAAGDRWWPIAGGVYFLQAVKRVRGLRLIMPRWTDRLAPAKSLVAAPKKVRDREPVAARQKIGEI
ncbi:MAG: class I SAM-dependent methyltransferase [Rhodospirillaceae bacterium]